MWSLASAACVLSDGLYESRRNPDDDDEVEVKQGKDLQHDCRMRAPLCILVIGLAQAGVVKIRNGSSCSKSILVYK